MAACNQTVLMRTHARKLARFERRVANSLSNWTPGSFIYASLVVSCAAERAELFPVGIPSRAARARRAQRSKWTIINEKSRFVPLILCHCSRHCDARTIVMKRCSFVHRIEWNRKTTEKLCARFYELKLSNFLLYIYPRVLWKII